jgi:hypothetical protein
MSMNQAYFCGQEAKLYYFRSSVGSAWQPLAGRLTTPKLVGGGSCTKCAITASNRKGSEAGKFVVPEARQAAESPGACWALPRLSAWAGSPGTSQHGRGPSCAVGSHSYSGAEERRKECAPRPTTGMGSSAAAAQGLRHETFFLGQPCVYSIAPIPHQCSLAHHASVCPGYPILNVIHALLVPMAWKGHIPLSQGYLPQVPQ